MPIYDCGAPDCDECQRAFGPDRSKAIELYRRRDKYYADIERARKAHTAPPCRVCGGNDVGCYPADNLFMAICPNCCEKANHPDGETGHEFKYDRSERDTVCQKCGISEHYDPTDGYISDRERI